MNNSERKKLLLDKIEELKSEVGRLDEDTTDYGPFKIALGENYWQRRGPGINSHIWDGGRTDLEYKRTFNFFKKDLDSFKSSRRTELSWFNFLLKCSVEMDDNWSASCYPTWVAFTLLKAKDSDEIYVSSKQGLCFDYSVGAISFSSLEVAEKVAVIANDFIKNGMLKV